jgi:tetratricopeptide (TPR) repeat protein
VTDTPIDAGQPAEGAAGERRWFLNDQREFLQRSLDDAEREHGAGDLSALDYDVLVARDRARLSEVEAELAQLGPESADEAEVRPPAPAEVANSDWRRVGIIAACFVVVAGAVILVDHALNPRLPGQSISGGITETKADLIEQQLSDALTLNNKGQIEQSLKLYDKVLTEDPNDPQALAASGWLLWNVGTEGNAPTLAKEGTTKEQKAIRVAPTFYAGHLFYGLILLDQDHNATAAVAQFNDLLTDNTPPAQLKADAPLLRVAYADAGIAVPAALAATPSTSTAPSSPTTTTSTP